jgi:hypothetical protein
MGGRRRAVLLTLLALAAPLPAFAISDQALKPVSADPGPAALSVSASLDSCGVLSNEVVCKIDASFNPLPNADGYSASVTRADGSVTDYGSVGPGGTSIWVPYVGAGSYNVKITAYGAPEKPHDPDGHGDVIAKGSSRGSSPWDSVTRPDKSDKPDGSKDTGDAEATVTEVTGRTDPNATQNEDATGTATSEVAASPEAPTCTTTTTTTTPAPDPPTPPELPPPDLDPENPDEDADGIPDEEEEATYQQELTQYQAALEAQANQPPPEPTC